jgi:nicotinamidase-related amidase
VRDSQEWSGTFSRFDSRRKSRSENESAQRHAMPRSPGHAFYDRLQDLLREAGFDAFVEGVCKPYYAPRMGA